MPEPVSITASLISAAVKAVAEQAGSAAGRSFADQLAKQLGRRAIGGAELESALHRKLEEEPALSSQLREWLLRIGAIDPVTASEFAASRAWLTASAGDLIEVALDTHAEFRESEDVPLLTRPGWIPASPMPLHPERVRLRRVMPNANDDLEPARRRLRELGYWPTIAGKSIRTYHEAISLLEDRSWYNGSSYRLMGVLPDADTIRLIFNDKPYGYFDMIDTGEPLAFETAWQVRSGLPAVGPYRSWLADPFDLAIRCAIPGTNVLTVRRSARSTLFYLHEREPKKVGLSAGTVHVVPAGEFQPVGDRQRALEDDFDLLHIITREYAEEFCGVAEARDREAPPIDYQNDPRYAPIYRALRSSGVLVRYLGIGLYPLTWKPEVLIVCIFDDKTFDRLFRNLEALDNAEGPLHLPPPPAIPRSRLKNLRKDRSYGGWDFTEENVRHWRDNSQTLPAGRACLGLAWRHRSELGLG
jgi:hypothetical protein